MRRFSWSSVRVLPATMVALACLLTVKSAGLVAAAYGAAEESKPGETAAPDSRAADAGKSDTNENVAKDAGNATAAPQAERAPEANKPESAKPEAGKSEVGNAEGGPARAAPLAVNAHAGETGNASDKAAPAGGEKAAGEATKIAEAAPIAPPPEPPVSAAERSLLQDLRKRRVALDDREVALGGREALLAAAEKRLAARLDELTALQKRLEGLEAGRQDRDEASWHGLVRVYEAMKPKDAAVIFNELDTSTLLGVADRMKDAKLAPVLSAMMPDRARRLTADLSQRRARVNAPPEALPAAATPPASSPAPTAGASP